MKCDHIVEMFFHPAISHLSVDLGKPATHCPFLVMSREEVPQETASRITGI
jgi:hypothetical protein